MKTFLKWAAAAMLAFVLLFTILIFAVGPVRYETRFEVDQPVSVAWEVFTDEARMKEWLPGFLSIETLEGEPLTVGSRYRLVFVENGNELVMEETVTAVVPEKEFAFLMVHEIAESDVRVRFEDLGGRTAIVTENEVRAVALLRPFIPLMKAGMIERQEEGYGALKALIEAHEG